MPSSYYSQIARKEAKEKAKREKKEQFLRDVAEDVFLDILAGMDENGVLDVFSPQPLEKVILTALEKVWDTAITTYQGGTPS